MHWDRALVREPRLLVPVDVIALVVRAGDESMVRLPFRSQDEPAPAHDDPGTPRPPGVHLLWTVPTAFGRGKVVDDPAAPGDPTRRVLDLPLLPDRWVVVRLCVPSGATDPIVRGWVIEADTATVTPLADWPSIRTNTQTVGTAVPADRLTVHVGGAMWTMCYDASLGRMALHDPLDDLAQIAPNGVVGDALSYVVAGWWDDVRNDPLDGVGSLKSYHGRLARARLGRPRSSVARERRRQLVREPVRRSRARSTCPKATRFTKSSTIAETMNPAVSGFAHEAIDVAVVPSAPTRTTLLHGRIHGVPLSSTVRPDDRPTRSQVRVALGPTSPSVAALLASGAFASGADENEQRNAERLLTAFSSGLLGRIEQPDVWPDIEQYEHAQGFSSLPGGVEAVDRFVDRPRTGNDPGSGFRHGRRGKNQTVVIDVAQELLWSADKYPTVALALAGRPRQPRTRPSRPPSNRLAGSDHRPPPRRRRPPRRWPP